MIVLSTSIGAVSSYFAVQQQPVKLYQLIISDRVSTVPVSVTRESDKIGDACTFFQGFLVNNNYFHPQNIFKLLPGFGHHQLVMK